MMYYEALFACLHAPRICYLFFSRDCGLAILHRFSLSFVVTSVRIMKKLCKFFSRLRFVFLFKCKVTTCCMLRVNLPVACVPLCIHGTFPCLCAPSNLALANITTRVQIITFLIIFNTNGLNLDRYAVLFFISIDFILLTSSTIKKVRNTATELHLLLNHKKQDICNKLPQRCP